MPLPKGRNVLSLHTRRKNRHCSRDSPPLRLRSSTPLHLLHAAVRLAPPPPPRGPLPPSRRLKSSPHLLHAAVAGSYSSTCPRQRAWSRIPAGKTGALLSP
ncbi:hypothetical protein GQ55_7G270900 [Panicum hallii var. hallii]|uniref:Uncharacterized protein n=1 Tax=Panicum hallii var. hallii TaxID=1504633 RepID=A0A2T7CZG8_9POAL|nr:hypothetical protein GQ55_7G270900 [Panicum hallii var. hallii]